MQMGVITWVCVGMMGYYVEAQNKASLAEPRFAEYFPDLDLTDSVSPGEYESYNLMEARDIGNFRVRQDKSSIVLTWDATGKDKFLFFEIERSTDNESFVQIGLVSSTPYPRDGVFSFHDRARYFGNKGYYRVKVTDHLGITSVSPVLEWKAGSQNSLDLKPLPASGSITIKLPEPFSAGVLVVRSTQGQILWRERIENPGEDDFVIPISDFPEGLVMVCLEQDTQIWSKLVMIYN